MSHLLFYWSLWVIICKLLYIFYVSTVTWRYWSDSLANYNSNFWSYYGKFTQMKCDKDKNFVAISLWRCYGTDTRVYIHSTSVHRQYTLKFSRVIIVKSKILLGEIQKLILKTSHGTDISYIFFQKRKKQLQDVTSSTVISSCHYDAENIV